MKASKISHKNEYRIKVDFPYDRQNVQKLKQIPDAKWSESQSSWHIPFSRVAKKPYSKPRIVTNEEGFFVTRC